MYRILIVFVLLNIAESSQCRGYQCHEKHKKSHYYAEDMFYQLAHRIISTERNFQNYCRDNMHTRFREVYGNSSYILKLYVPELKFSDITIQVMHKAVYIKAEEKFTWALKMLPDNLNAEEASWTLKNSKLEINFPYAATVGEETKKSCGNIKYYVITVPMSNRERDENPDTFESDSEDEMDEEDQGKRNNKEVRIQ